MPYEVVVSEIAEEQRIAGFSNSDEAYEAMWRFERDHDLGEVEYVPAQRCKTTGQWLIVVVQEVS